MTLYRVTAQSLEVLSVSAADLRVSAQSLEVLTPTYQIRLPKAYGLAVIGPKPASVAISKGYALAVLDDGSLPAFDPYWSNVVLLCHFDGANGASSTIDSSPSAHTPIILQPSQSSISTAQAKFGTASLLTAANSVGYAIVSTGLTDFQFGAGQFTVEAWVYFTSHSASNIYAIAGNYKGSTLGWDFGQVLGQAAFYYSTNGSSNAFVGANFTPALNTWYHFAADRDASNVLRVYVNGAVVASATVAATLHPSVENLYIGNDGNINRGFPGHIDELRITKGISRYGGAFSVPLVAFPDSGTPPVVGTTRRRPVLAFVG